MQNIIFPILKFEKGCHDKKRDLGTGFFVNSEGVFITAAHVCDDENFDYYGLINSKLHSLQKIYSEYKNEYEISDKNFNDLFIGKIIGLEQSAFLVFNDESVLIKDMKLSVFGYRSEPLPNDNQILNSVKLDYPELCIYLNFYEISAVFYANRIIHTQNKDPHICYFNNAITVKTENLQLFGLSGGPLIFDGKCYGMLFRADRYLSATYIINKLYKYY